MQATVSGRDQAPGDGDAICTDEIFDGVTNPFFAIHVQCTLLVIDLSWTPETIIASSTKVGTCIFLGKVWIEIITTRSMIALTRVSKLAKTSPYGRMY